MGRQLFTAAALAAALGAAAATAQTDGTLDGSFDRDGGRRAAGRRILVAGTAAETGLGLNSAIVRLTAAGAVDTSFGGGPFTFGDGADEWATDLLIEPSGSVLVASVRQSGATEYGYRVHRYSAAGAYETGLGLGATTNARPMIRLARDPVSGKLLIAVAAWDGTKSQIRIGRYDGNLNPDFSYGGGELRIEAPGDWPTYLSDLEVLPDGRLIVAGYVRTAGAGHDFLVARATQAGSLDPTFGDQGLSQVPIDFVVNGSARVSSVALDASGRIVLTGSVDATGYDDEAAVLLRLSASGGVDPEFNGGEPLVVADTDGDDALGGLAVQSDGRIVVAGRVFGPASPMFFAARYWPDGAADWSFGSFGVFTANFPNSPNDDYAVALALSGGRAVLVGPAEWSAPDYDFGVMRLASSLIFADDLERGSTGGWSLAAP